jgi:hypothetical protein
MRLTYFATAVAAMVVVANAANADDSNNLNRLLHGTFSMTGPVTCFYSPAGFNSDLTPVSPPSADFVVWASFLSTRIFNGDGTGSDDSTIIQIQLPGRPIEQVHATSKLTYTVAPDLTVTIQNDGPVNAEVVAGPADAVGSTNTVDHLITSGKLSQDHRNLTQASTTPQVENLAFSSGLTLSRICNRAWTLNEVSNQTESQ